MLTDLNTLAQSLAQSWLAFSVVLAVQIGLILLLRKPVRTRLGAVACYRLWLLPLLCLPFYLAGPTLMQKLASVNAFMTQQDTQPVSNLQQFIDFELLPFDINAEFAGLSARLQRWPHRYSSRNASTAAPRRISVHKCRR